MNDIELSAVLYYADFLSMKANSYPVTDNCKYFFVYGIPMNSLFILNLRPIYDENNQYFQQAYAEYNILKNKFGDSGVKSFIDDICSIKACGSVDGQQMLKCIHQFSSKRERRTAFNTYQTWKSKQKYTHIVANEDGDDEEKECTPYIYHFERMCK